KESRSVWSDVDRAEDGRRKIRRKPGRHLPEGLYAARGSPDDDDVMLGHTLPAAHAARGMPVAADSAGDAGDEVVRVCLGDLALDERTRLGGAVVDDHRAVDLGSLGGEAPA